MHEQQCARMRASVYTAVSIFSSTFQQICSSNMVQQYVSAVVMFKTYVRSYVFVQVFQQAQASLTNASCRRREHELSVVSYTDPTSIRILIINVLSPSYVHMYAHKHVWRTQTEYATRTRLLSWRSLKFLRC
jgi:hypothetical protein